MTDVAFLSIAELAGQMAAGDLTSVELTRLYLQRIADSGLRAVLETNPDAEEIALRLDRERRDGHTRGPLHGMPILIKDNIDTADRMHTTAGSLALLESRPRRDATVVARLRAAGAVVLGKTNLSEWSGYRGFRMPEGWSARGGQTRNPYGAGRSPAGSSSGSAAAVASGLCAAALGTETAGSIVYPASVCGVVGLKPTVGLTSRTGVIPATISADTVGPLARSVADAATVLAAIAEPDAPSPTGASGGLRVGVARQIGFGQSRHSDAAAETAIEALRAAGVEIVDPVEVPSAGVANTQETIAVAVAYELKHSLNAYLAERADPIVRCIADLIAFNERRDEQELSLFGQEILQLAQALGGPLTDPVYLDALARMRRWGRDEGVDAALRTHRLAAILVPNAGPAAMIDNVNGDHPADAQCELPAFAGYPAITVPSGQVRGLPLGAMLMTTAYQEPALVRLALLLERAGLAWQPPV